MGAGQSAINDSDSEAEEEEEEEELSLVVGEGDGDADKEDGEEQDEDDDDEEELEQEPEVSPFHHSQSPLDPQDSDVNISPESFKEHPIRYRGTREELAEEAMSLDHSGSPQLRSNSSRLSKNEIESHPPPSSHRSSTAGSLPISVTRLSAPSSAPPALPHPSSPPLPALTPPHMSPSDRSPAQVLPTGDASPVVGSRVLFPPQDASSSLLHESAAAGEPHRSRGRDAVTEIYVIRHGEATHNLATVIGGRSPAAPLTPLGRQQAKLLGSFLRDYQGLRFDAVYSSPIVRAMETAIIVSKETGFPSADVAISDSLQELSQGSWENQERTAIYHPGVLEAMTAAQPDFRAPGGESQRQVEFRMVQFVTNIVLPPHSFSLEGLYSRPFLLPSSAYQATKSGGTAVTASVKRGHSKAESKTQYTSDPEVAQVQRNSASTVGTSDPAGGGGIAGRSSRRLSTEALRNGEVGQVGISSFSGADAGGRGKEVRCVALVSHGTAIKCLLRGLLMSDPHMTHKIDVDNTSVTVLRYSCAKGWQVARLNDTTHLVLAQGPLRSRDAGQV